MARHSKNNTALGHFTYAEKSKTDYGTKKQRLGKDSMKIFDSCYLCLQKARTPLSCSKGHIACKECIIEHIVTQRTALLRQSKLAKQQEEDLKKKEALKQEEEKQSQIMKFEKVQAQVTSVKGLEDKNIKEENKKRNSLDSEEEISTVKQDQRSLGTGYAESKLPAFWVPALTPAIDKKMIEAPKNLKITNCTAKEPHPITLKKLISVKFDFNEDKKDKEEAECPSCLKKLNNAMKPILLASCGHVLCNNCTTKFVAPSKSCFKCGVECKDIDDLIYLQHDGTGYASGGGVVLAKKFGVAFQ